MMLSLCFGISPKKQTQVCQSGREASQCVIELTGDAQMHALLVQHMLVIAFDKAEHQR